MRRDTLLDFFHDFSTHRGDFLVYDDGFRARSYTYGETAAAARAFAARLQMAGIGKGDNVLFWSENRPEWIIAFWGCLLNGSVAVPIDYRASQVFAASPARSPDAKLVVVGDDVTQEERGQGSSSLWKLSEIDWTGPGTFAQVAVAHADVAEI